MFQRITTEKYLKMFGDVFEYVETDKFVVAVFPNPYDDFRFFSYINGVHTRNGGTHIDVLTDEMIVPRIKDKLAKKHKNIKYGDVKNKIQLVVLMSELPSKFGGQTKEILEVGRPELRTYFSDIAIDKFSEKILKNKEIIDPITEIFELKEKQKLNKELSALDKKPKKIRNDKFTAPSHAWKYCFLAEGESAVGGLMPSLGRKDYGYFELRGVPMNVQGTALKDIIKNQEYKGLADVLGLKWTGDNLDLTFEYVVISTDQDLDGFRIRGLLFGFFNRFAPELLKAGRIKVLSTPLMLLKKDDTVVKAYFDFDEFDNKDIKRGHYVKYLKGIGSWTPQEFEQVLDMYGLDGLIHTYNYDEETEMLIDHWLGDDSLVRREYLQNNSFNINDL